MSTLFVQHQTDALPSPEQEWIVKGTDQAIVITLSNWNPYGGGAVVKNVSADIPTKTLTVSIDSPSEGSMGLSIPISFMTATVNDTQTKFTVLVDGTKVTYDLGVDRQGFWEIEGVPYTNGTHQIDIIGTQMIGSRSLNSIPLQNGFPLSPLRQFQAGVSPVNTICNQDFVLMIKTSGGLPACLILEHAKELMERGWGVPINSPFPIIVNHAKSPLSQNNSATSSIIVTPPEIQQTSGNNTLPDSFEPCDTPYPQSNTGIAVLYMPANSIGKICVRYNNLNDSPAPIGISVSNANDMNQNATGITTWSDSTSNTIPKGSSIIVYWVKTGNQTGLYGLTIFCVGMPFAVGYNDQSNITATDFPWIHKIVECPAMTYQYQIDSLSGIGIKQIQ